MIDDFSNDYWEIPLIRIGFIIIVAIVAYAWGRADGKRTK